MTQSVPRMNARTDPIPTDMGALRIRRPLRVRKLSRALLGHAALILFCLAFLVPIYWMASTSLKPLDQTMAYPPKMLPTRVDFATINGHATPVPQNYYDATTNENFDFVGFSRNTLIIAVLSVIGAVFSGALVAYGFAKIPFKGRGLLFAVMLATMMIPFPVTMVPMFSIFRWIGDHTPFQMLGTARPLWLPTFFGNAFNIFLLRQFFAAVPDDLAEAARIDGCGEFGIFWRIMLPLSKPALIVVGLFTFMWAWNDFMGPLVYLQRPEQYTLALGLQAFQSQHNGTPWNQLMAASLLIVAPVLILYFIAQRAFVQGIATSGLK